MPVQMPRSRPRRRLIKAKAGEIIEFGPGKFEFTATLSLDESSVTIRGQGPDKTILSFKNQGQGTGGEGLLVTSKTGITLQDLAVEDAKGDAIKVNGTKGLFIRNVRTEWTGGPSETNGGYGLYPVLCSDVLIENCVVKGASDAGIYVGQSENIIVRRNKVEQNVAGIEIENCTRADVYENLATDNAGGILVFTMPDLPKKDGRHCRVYKNTVQANNHENFAPKGNIVATVPPGTGVMIMASDQVEVFDNTIENNQTSRPVHRQLPAHRQAVQGRQVRPILRVDPHPRQSLQEQWRETLRSTRPARQQGRGHTAAGNPLRWHGQSQVPGRRVAAAGTGDPHPQQRRRRFRQFRRGLAQGRRTRRNHCCRQESQDRP